MKDVFGYEIEEGDRIAFNPPQYKGLSLGIVIGFTPKKIKIRYRGHFSKDETNAFPSDVAIDMHYRLANKIEDGESN